MRSELIFAFVLGLAGCAAPQAAVPVKGTVDDFAIDTTVDSPLARYYVEVYLAGGRTAPEWDALIAHHELRLEKGRLSRDDYRPDPENDGVWLAESTGFGETVRLPSGSEDAVTLEAVVFQAQRGDGQVITALYFFLANGNAVASSYDVRFSFDFRDRYSYYSKVELMFPGVEEPEAVVRFAEDMLSDLLPEIMACLPDWTEVQAGTYPEAD